MTAIHITSPQPWITWRKRRNSVSESRRGSLRSFFGRRRSVSVCRTHAGPKIGREAPGGAIQFAVNRKRELSECESVRFDVFGYTLLCERLYVGKVWQIAVSVGLRDRTELWIAAHTAKQLE